MRANWGWRRSVLAALAVSIGGCRSAASVFLDLPEQPREEAAPAQDAVAQATPQGQAVLQALVDTQRPPIEATLDPDSARALLPVDAHGNVDWVAALRDGVIAPRFGLPNRPPPPEMRGFRYDKILRNPVPMFNASFAHSTHVEWLDCRTCHPRLFPSDSAITMQAINAGEACGACHGKVAYPPTACARCHGGLPAPRLAEDRPPAVLIGDLVLARKSDSTAQTSFPPARFPHWVHRVRYRCMACHPTLFEARAGADTLTMDPMRRGEACGVCHNDRDAFGLVTCGRCHVGTGPPGDAEP